jgi:hypothetical protein
LISEYSTFLATANVGSELGQYAEGSKWVLEDAIAAAQTFLTANQGSQFLIDAKVADLKAAYTTFLAAVNYTMVYPSSAGETQYPFESGIYYIQVGDYYLTVPKNGANNTYMQLRAYIDNPDGLHNNQVWNVQYNTTYSDLSASDPYALYSIVSDVTTWDADGNWHLDEVGRMKTGGTTVAQSADGSNWDWREHRLYYNGTGYSIVNNHNKNALVFENETLNEQAKSLAAKKFNFKFRTVSDVVNGNAIQSATGAKAGVFGGKGEIVISGAAGNTIAVYDISGRLVKTVKAANGSNTVSLGSGLYIVKVAGQATKVIVK